jgi:DNA-directed RNA polymerase
MMNQTPVQRQWNLERAAKAEAVKRLRERTRTAEESNYASSTVYGTALIKSRLVAITEEIRSNIHKIAQGSATKYGEAVAFVGTMDPEVLALITVKMVLDHTKISIPRNTYQFLCNVIGTHVYDEYLLQKFEQDNPDAFDHVRRSQRGKRKGYSYKVQDYRAKMRKVSQEVPRWPSGVKHKVGAWLFDRLVTATGWARVSERPTRHKRVANLVFATDEFLELRQGLLEQAEVLAWCNWPMLCEPLPWSDSRRGGYLSEELRSTTRMVRRRGSVAVKQGLDHTPALAMLNRLQRTPYRVNRLVYEVAKECQERGVSIGKFYQERPIDPPTKPDWDKATDEAKLEYRRERTRIEDHNHTLGQKNYRSNECLFVAEKFIDENEFWIPWSFDYRGRVYPLATSLSPQGTDFEKALFLFSEEGPVNEYWLAFHVATTYGLDKSSMEDRQEWVSNNHDLISRIANDPLSHLSEWSDVSEPWCFLASCVEYNDCVIEKIRSTSGLPISVDATCSGLQHLSALTLDRSAAEMVNVVPTLRPTDAYAVVAERAKTYLPESVHPLLNRKVTKRTVMTVPYGVTMNSARDYIRQELPRELPPDVTLTEIVRAIYQKAIPDIIPGPIKAMGFIQKSVAEVVKAAGATYVMWVTPSGFPVVQDLRKMKAERVTTKLLGSRVYSVIQSPTDEPDLQHHKGASAPNLIHSLDAALLHLTFAECDKPFTLIHDCLLMRACDLDWANTRIRRVFVDMYSKPILKDWSTQLGATFDEGMMINTLDIKDSLNSTYLFC